MTTIILIIIGILILYTIFVYNSIISLQNQVKNSFSGIDVQLKRRNDLIPNLIETVKGYAKHEKDVLENVTNMRTQMISAMDTGYKSQIAKTQDMLSETLKSLFAVSENYPDLKANQNFLELQNQIATTEDQIAASRRIYNSNTMVYNSKLQVFPNNLLVKIFNFKEYEFFKATAQEKENIKVEL